jgi:heat-inducible transcriptional repressor
MYERTINRARQYPAPGTLPGPRHQQVLAEVVRLHIETGEPVSSRAIARRHPEPLSPATIRNVMADLEDAGYLYQPHTSAGRVPTALGYQYFIEHFATQARLRPADEQWIREQMSTARTFEEKLERAGQILAKISHGLGLTLSPPMAQMPIEHIRLLLVPGGRLLVVLITQDGITRDKLVIPPEPFTQEELDRISAYLNQHYRGWTLERIRSDLAARLARVQDSWRRIALGALELCDPELLADEPDRQLRVEGTAQIATAPEFSDQQRLGALFAAVEEKRRLIELLSRCIATPEPLFVQVGVSELAAAGPSLALIGARYCAASQGAGLLGVLGPLRMDYERAVTAATFLARLIGSPTE